MLSPPRPTSSLCCREVTSAVRHGLLEHLYESLLGSRDESLLSAALLFPNFLKISPLCTTKTFRLKSKVVTWQMKKHVCTDHKFNKQAWCNVRELWMNCDAARFWSLLMRDGTRMIRCGRAVALTMDSLTCWYSQLSGTKMLSLICMLRSSRGTAWHTLTHSEGA